VYQLLHIFMTCVYLTVFSFYTCISLCHRGFSEDGTHSAETCRRAYEDKLKYILHIPSVFAGISITNLVHIILHVMD